MSVSWVVPVSVNGVVGDATQRAKRIVESARGCVLMIDEAYALNPSGGGGGVGAPGLSTTGPETVDAIMQAMPTGENADCCIILGASRGRLASCCCIEAPPSLLFQPATRQI